MKIKTLVISLLLIFCLLMTSCAGRNGADSKALPEIPKGAVKLANKEKESVRSWFEEDYLRRRFLLSTYNSVKDVDLYSLFLLGTDDGYETDINDISLFLSEYGWWGDFELSRITEEGMNEILQKYGNISFSDCSKRHLDGLYEVEAASCRYSVHGNVETAAFRPTGGYEEGDTIYVFYDSSVFVNKRLTGTFRVTLIRQDNGYVIAANEFFNDGEYIIDLYEPSQESGVFDSEDTVEKLSVEASNALSGSSEKEAVSNIRAQEGFLNVTLDGLGSIEDSPYGKVLGGLLDGRFCLYFITDSGTVYELPLPDDDVEKKDLSFYAGENYMVYSHQKTSSDEDALSVKEFSYTLLLPTGELFLRTVKSEYIKEG